MNHELSLNGPWSFRQAGMGRKRVADWQAAVVPGTVHTDLLTAGLIADPFYRTNELDVRWVEDADWRYRREFDCPAELLAGMAAVWLEFDGLDTLATITLNGKRVAATDNMFHGWRFEVRKLLKPGRNILEVEFASAAGEGNARAAKSKVQYKSSFFEPRVYLRKAQYSGGWDWGPRLLTCGAWRPVRLRAVAVAAIRNVFVKADKISAAAAELEIEVAIEAHKAGAATLEVELTAPDGRTSTERAKLKLAVGERTYRVKVKVAKPLLWWPVGHGEQPLYDVRTTLKRDEEVLDTHRQRTGLRTIELVRRKDKQGECFRLAVNGKEIFCKGANWVPGDSFLPRFTETHYRARLQDARDANMNMVRVWGGGVYEDPAFYAICDELGLMVWQDFMFGCAEYPDDKAFLASVKREATEAVRAIRHHPSVVLWCGNNENQWGFDEWWPPRPRRYGEVIYDEVLPEVCGVEDPTRPYWPGSPYGGPMANNPDFGDMHDWSVWIFWKNPEAYLKSRGRFISEFGFQSMPCGKTVAGFTAPEDRHLFSRVIDFHNRCDDGHPRNLKFLAHGYGVPADLDGYVYMSQVAQADAIKMGVEHWRRRWPDTAGALYWQHNDCWPVASWSALDWHGRPKALWYASRRFFAPVLLSVVAGEDPYGVRDLELWVANDGPALAARIEAEVWSLAGERLSRHEAAIKSKANSAGCVHRLKAAALKVSDPDDAVLHVRCWQGDTLVGECYHYFAPAKYLKWREPAIRTKIAAVAGGLRLTVSAQRAARAVRLEADRWEGRFSDNWFDLAPGQSREVIWRSAEAVPAPAEFERGLTVRALTTPGVASR